MAFKYPLINVKEYLVSLDFENIYIDNIQDDTSTQSSLQSAIFLIPETTQNTLINIQFLDFACYVRSPDIDIAFSKSWEIWHSLNGKMGDFGTVGTNGNLKIKQVEGLSSPYLYSTVANGGNMCEYVTRFRLQYLDTNFVNF